MASDILDRSTADPRSRIRWSLLGRSRSSAVRSPSHLETGMAKFSTSELSSKGGGGRWREVAESVVSGKLGNLAPTRQVTASAARISKSGVKSWDLVKKCFTIESKQSMFPDRAVLSLPRETLGDSLD